MLRYDSTLAGILIFSTLILCFLALSLGGQRQVEKQDIEDVIQLSEHISTSLLLKMLLNVLLLCGIWEASISSTVNVCLKSDDLTSGRALISYSSLNIWPTCPFTTILSKYQCYARTPIIALCPQIPCFLFPSLMHLDHGWQRGARTTHREPS